MYGRSVIAGVRVGEAKDICYVLAVTATDQIRCPSCHFEFNIGLDQALTLTLLKSPKVLRLTYSTTVSILFEDILTSLSSWFWCALGKISDNQVPPADPRSIFLVNSPVNSAILDLQRLYLVSSCGPVLSEVLWLALWPFMASPVCLVQTTCLDGTT